MISYGNLTLQNFGSWINSFYDAIVDVSGSRAWNREGSWDGNMNEKWVGGMIKNKQKSVSISRNPWGWTEIQAFNYSAESDLPENLVPFIKKLNTHLAQESDKDEIWQNQLEELLTW